MEQAELAARLAEADEAERAELLAQSSTLVNVALAQALKALYDKLESSDPAQAAGAATALAAVAGVANEPEISALAAWTTRMAALDAGQMEAAITRLDDARARFDLVGQPQTAAATQVSKLYALAVLGRYDEALACGLWARDIFLAHGSLLAAGKIEQNLGNIHFRRDHYPEAEQAYRDARERFVATADQKQLAQIDNCLGTVLASQQQFREAERSYEQARARAEAAGLDITLAEIECNLGCLAQFQGRYDQALDYLERSRRRYVALDRPHESAIAEQELADVYLDLNLAPEAAAIYARVTPLFAQLGMRAEQARALAYHGRADLLLGHIQMARTRLAEAHTLYSLEGNSVGEAIVTLIEAQSLYLEGNYAAAAETATQAVPLLAAAGAWGRWLLARWLQGEASRAQGLTQLAQTVLEETLRTAEAPLVPQIAQRCHTSLGLLAMAAGEAERAETAFRRAIDITEAMRAPLPAEEFRSAFVADKLTAYAELVRVCLEDSRTDRVAEAFGYVERARSRALVEMLGGGLPARPAAGNLFEAERLTRLEELREELSWLYSQLNRPDSTTATRGAGAMAALYQTAHQREAEILEITRQLQQGGYTEAAHIEPVEISQLQQFLGAETALVEYYSLDGQLLAFVVTDEGIEVMQLLGGDDQIVTLVEQLHFQMGALRYSPERLRVHLTQLTQRVGHYLSALYDLLLRPLEDLLGQRRLVVVPHQALHYIPFHALHDGAGYVIERREVCYVPSAAVLRHCVAAPRRPLRRAVLLGVPDAQAPRVRDEVIGLAGLFPEARLLLAEQATHVALHDQAPAADVLHLACHGAFRPDSPLFSAVRLADGWLTVRDAYGLNLKCELVTLSACETGRSSIAPGDELMGLARGFFLAGAPSLLMSLWTVDDEATAKLMASFYTRLLAGDGPATALRHAQCQIMKDGCISTTERLLDIMVSD